MAEKAAKLGEAETHRSVARVLRLYQELGRPGHGHQAKEWKAGAIADRARRLWAALDDVIDVNASPFLRLERAALLAAVSRPTSASLVSGPASRL